MGTGLKVLIALVVVLGITGLSLLTSTIGINNSLVAQENSIKAQYKNNQNVYDNYFKKVQEIAQVQNKYASDMKQLLVGTIQGRYGKEGSKALFQFIKEHNPSLDSAVYIKLQQVMESGRMEFQNNQTMLLDQKRVYETQLQQFPTNVIARLLGFPKIDLASMDIVTSDVTEKAFQTKKSDPIQIQ